MTTNQNGIMIMGAVVACLVFIFINAGCDVASSSDVLTISPSTATLAPGQSVTFTVAGGYEYSWSLNPNDGSGALSAITGSQVTYTCLASNIGTTPKMVIVASTITGSGGVSSTNSTGTNGAYEVDVTAQIYYSYGVGASTSTSSLAISPVSATVGISGTQVFTVSGGTLPYTWSVFNTSIGSISSSTGTTTTYLRTGNGANQLTVTDASANSVSVLITQP